MKQYQFSYLRYIHDVSTEEFVNIGIVMFIPTEGKLMFRLTEHYSRLSEFYLDFKGDNYKYLLGSLKDRLLSAQEYDFPESIIEIGKILPEIVPIESGCFQWSATMCGIVEHPEKRLERLFKMDITAHEKSKKRTRREDKDIVENFNNLLRKKGLLRDIESNVLVQNYNLNYSYQFKYGWQNGKPQFAEPISLDYKNKKDLENKVSSFIGDMFSLSGSKEFQVTGIIAPPSYDKLQQEFETAVERLKEVPQIRKVILEDEIQDLIPIIQKDILANKLKFG